FQLVLPIYTILPDYDGQEPPHTYYAKLRAINETARPLGIAAFNTAERANIMKSKITGKYRETMIGNQRASLKALMNEKFTSLDTIDTYEKRIRPYVLGFNDAEVLLYLYDHLPSRLKTRIRIANPNTVNDFIMQLRIIWLESGGPTSNFENENNSISINQFPQKNIALDYLDTIAERLGYLNYGLRDLNDLIKFIDYELYNRLGHANYNFKKEPFGQDSKVSIKTSKKVYNTKKPVKKFAKKLSKKLIKVTYKCSNCEKIGYRKNMCPSLVKKLKKVNNVYQSKPENSDDEEDQFDLYYGEKYTVKEQNKDQTSNSSSHKETSQSENLDHSITLNYAIKVYQGAQIRQNWPNPFEIDFLDIKESNDVAMILCRIGDLIIPYAILDTGANDSLYTDNIPEYLEIKIDKKNVHKLTGAVEDFQSIDTTYNVPIIIGTEEDSITVSEKEISAIPTKKDRNGKDISIMILGTKWQYRVGWDPIVKGEFTATHNGKTITIPLSTRKESHNAFNTEKLQVSEIKKNQ
ncbi:13751_t:CDS:2, partial [Acaulospora morrowiae]